MKAKNKTPTDDGSSRIHLNINVTTNYTSEVMCFSPGQLSMHETLCFGTVALH